MPELVYWPAADRFLDQLESDPAMAPVRRAVARIERRLAVDPFNPRLGTISFMSDELGGINATPVGMDDWYVIWQRGEDQGTIEIVEVYPLRV
jgi:hypothetical protein